MKPAATDAVRAEKLPAIMAELFDSLRSRQISQELDAAPPHLDGVVASCDACHQRFRVMPAAHAPR